MIAVYRPAAPSASILDEIVCDDLDRRFAACEAVAATIWAAGLNSCSSPTERVCWQHRYSQYLKRLCSARQHKTAP